MPPTPFQTLLFGGNNPPFLPGWTADQETRYIEVQVNNTKEDAKKIDPKIAEAEIKTSKYPYHGIINHNYECDDLLSLVQDCKTDKELIKKKKEAKVSNEKAEKVIQKYNSNSFRVL